MCICINHVHSSLLALIFLSHFSPPQVVMLTGDNPLTACHVAKELKIAQKKLLILTKTNDDEWVWQSVSGATTVAMDTRLPELGKKFDLCLTGDVRIPLEINDVFGIHLCVSLYVIDGVIYSGTELFAKCEWRQGFLFCSATREGLCTSDTQTKGEQTTKTKHHRLFMVNGLIPVSRRLWLPPTSLLATTL